MEIKLKSRKGGKRALTPEQRKLLVDFSKWISAKLFPRIDDKVSVTVVLDKTLYSSNKTYGTSVWEDVHRKGREFTVELDTSFNFLTVILTLAHELVHVKQWATGEWYQLFRESYVDAYSFNGEIVDAAYTNYWDLPWEVEAHGRSIGLVAQWIKHRSLEKEEWTKIKLPIT